MLLLACLLGLLVTESLSEVGFFGVFFFFLGKESIATNYRVDFKNVFILVRRVKISPSIMLANNASLSKMPAQYPIKRVVVCFEMKVKPEQRHPLAIAHLARLLLE